MQKGRTNTQRVVESFFVFRTIVKPLIKGPSSEHREQDSPTPATTKEQSEMVALFLSTPYLKAVSADGYNQLTVCLVRLKRTYTANAFSLNP